MICTIFFAEFHPQQGPIISYDLPFKEKPESSTDSPSVLQKWMESISEYIIPKHELCGNVLTLLNGDYLIMSCPITIENAKYERNALIFNMAFVFNKEVDCEVYEVIVWKCAYFLERLELECSFLSEQDLKKQKLPGLMKQIFKDLNQYGETSVSLQLGDSIDFTLNLRKQSPMVVKEEDVPVLINQISVDYNLDLSIQRILSHIDGINHVKKISQLAKVDIDIAKRAIQHLIYYNFIILTDIFKFSNIYCVQEKLKLLLQSDSFAQRCKLFVRNSNSKAEKVNKTFLFKLYNCFNQGVRVEDILKHNQDIFKEYIDIRKLLIFGTSHGLLKRIHEYPVLSATEKSKYAAVIPSNLLPFLSGQYSKEKICVKLDGDDNGISKNLANMITIRK